MSSRKQPNFLFITTDQQRASHLGCYGNSEIKTPHIDGLAATGRRFSRFYVASGVCMANRASMMTGRYPSLHGVRCNGIPLDKNAVTFVDLLRAGGYRTSLAGKCHLQNMTDLDAEIATVADFENQTPPPIELREAVRRAWNNGEYENELVAKWRNDPNHIVKTPYYGFENVDLCSHHGDLVEGQYFRWLSLQVPDAEALRGEANAVPDKRYKLSQAYRTRIPEKLYPTSWIADRTISQLNDAANDKRPFFLHCSFTDPHHPFTPPGRYWDMYDPEQVTIPQSAFSDGKDDGGPVAILRNERKQKRAKTNSTVAYSANEQEIRQAIALTYGMITMIDDAVGRVLSHLAKVGLDKNTIVIFTSDHGDFMGHHGLLLKSALHYSSLIQVPFIWSDAKLPQAGAATEGLWSTMDIGATILERAGLATCYGSQGKSFFSALQDQEQKGRASILVEEDGHAPTFGLNTPVRARTAVTDKHRLTIYDQSAWGELYDLETDAEEIHNLFDEAESAGHRADMFETLSRLLLEADDRLPVPIKRA